MGVSREMERIQADGQITAYVAHRTQPSCPHGMMDHYSSQSINTNMLLNVDSKAEES